MTFPKRILCSRPPPWILDLLPEADPQPHRRRSAHHPPLPSILPANIQSLDNKVDKIRAQVAFQRDIRDCNILCFTETWLTRVMVSESVQPPGFFMRHADRNKRLSGRKKGGGVCLMINDSWCNHNNIQSFLFI